MQVILQLDNVELFDIKQAEKKATALLEIATQTILENWKKQAQMKLKSSQKEYLKGLYVRKENIYINDIILKGIVANMIEKGVSPFDIKKGLLKSAKAKTSKEGKKFIVVPLGNSGKILRTVSEKTNANAWIHSGIKAYNLADEALKNSNIDAIISKKDGNTQ